ncbi:hypothetical protein IKF74_01545 [Candidatus Saccharibacteria bacterium]|nr:hypothetical protein [Candidatus Saccharibacteria bacterium]
MSKLMNSRLGLASIVASVAVGLFLLVGTTSAVLVCETVGTTTEGGGDNDDDPETPPTVTGGCDSTETTIKYYLMQAGYNETAAAAIMGNLSKESCGYKYKVCFCDCMKEAPDGFKAYTLQNGSYVANQQMRIQKSNGKYTWCGFGLVQWTHDSNPSVDRLLRLQKYADGQGKNITDLEVQIEFMIAELTTSKYGTYYSKVLKPEILNKYSLKDATWRVEKWYESPASVSGSPGYGASYATVCSDKTTSWCKSLMERVKQAEAALKLNANCTPGGSNPDTPSDPGDPSSPTGPDPVPVVPTSGGETPTVSDSGALGAQSANGMIGQYDSGVKNLVWRKDGSTISASGCSLVAVVNAAKATGHSSVSASSLASWSKSNISSASWDNLKKMASHVGLSTGSWLWSSKSTSDSEKLSKIRSVLASGGVVIAGGDRSGTNFSCEDASNRDSGKCVFTPGGHFVAIIGITADNKLVVANPARASNRTWIFPASGLLQYSNKAVMAK